jgi:hypothetical protein
VGFPELLYKANPQLRFPAQWHCPVQRDSGLITNGHGNTGYFRIIRSPDDYRITDTSKISIDIELFMIWQKNICKN